MSLGGTYLFLNHRRLPPNCAAPRLTVTNTCTLYCISMKRCAHGTRDTGPQTTDHTIKVSRFNQHEFARSNCDIRQIMYRGDVRFLREVFILISQFDSKLRDWLQIARYPFPSCEILFQVATTRYPVPGTKPCQTAAQSLK